MTTQRHIAYIGNFRPEFSTENHLRQALTSLGHVVEPLQEDDPETWAIVSNIGVVGEEGRPDLVLWTRTWALDKAVQRRALDACRNVGVPVVGYHLDRWWGLGREHQVADEPFFQSTVVVTADGGHDDRWAAAGVRHWWMPPAVLGAEASRPAVPLGMAAPIIFVGSGHRYHDEWPWRRELVRRLSIHYGRRFQLWPRKQGEAIRGDRLNALYRSGAVVVGDSCLAGSPSRYWSDRVPETLGRGGFLIHPKVEGMPFGDGEHLALVEPENWDAMRDAIDSWLDAGRDARDEVAARGRAEVLANHTYEVRMAALLDRLATAGLISPLVGGEGEVTMRRQDVGTARFSLRPGSTDGVVLHETWNENVYNLTADDVAGKVVIDLGANIGAFTVWAAAAGATVHAVEPSTANRRRLMGHVAGNGLDGSVTVYAEAVDASFGQAKLVMFDGGEGGAQLIRPGEPWEDQPSAPAGVEQVDTVPLSVFVREAGGHADVVKIDVEGGEWEALAGAAADGTLADVDRIVGEWHALTDHITAGRFLTGMLRYGTLRIFGAPARGGQFEWRRYGA